MGMDGWFRFALARLEMPRRGGYNDRTQRGFFVVVVFFLLGARGSFPGCSLSGGPKVF